MPLSCQEASGKFLEQIAAHDPAAMHVVIQDGAGFHLPENDPRLPENVRVITLPAYRPELNPVEKLWDHLKDAICNRIFATVEELREALAGPPFTARNLLLRAADRLTREAAPDTFAA